MPPTASLSAPLALLLCFALAPSPSASNYRHFHVDNADICNTGKLLKSKTLQLGTGAALFELRQPSQAFQPNYRNKNKICEIHLRAPEGHGLLVYIEEMNLREDRRDGDCVDYVQFGLNDRIPFVTLQKSDRLCGYRDGRIKNRVGPVGRDSEAYPRGGYAYDDPYGNLLVWVNVGGRRQTTNWPQISVVNLTLVVTSYQKDCRRPKTNFRHCGDRRKCVLKHYFCDRHINCGTDVIPADEEGCVYEGLGGLEHTTLSPGSGGGGGGSGSGVGANLVTIVVTVVTAVFWMVIIGVCMVVRYMRGKSFRARSRDGQDCPDQPRSIEALSRSRNRRTAEENEYLPLSAAGRPRLSRRSTSEYEETAAVTSPSSGSAMGGGPPTEEPPPAYEELFPQTERRLPENPDLPSSGFQVRLESTIGPEEWVTEDQERGQSQTT